MLELTGGPGADYRLDRAVHCGIRVDGAAVQRMATESLDERIPAADGLGDQHSIRSAFGGRPCRLRR